MLYTVAELSELISLSKVSIYNKLKLKELEPHIIKNKGITYVTEEGFNLIKESLNLKEPIESDLKEKEVTVDVAPEEIEDSVNLKEDYINYLKQENERLWNELSEKNNQLNNKDDLLENMQVLIKQEQIKALKYSENHYKEVDLKLDDIRNSMLQRGKKKFSLKSIFKRNS